MCIKYPCKCALSNPVPNKLLAFKASKSSTLTNLNSS